MLCGLSRLVVAGVSTAVYLFGSAAFAAPEDPGSLTFKTEQRKATLEGASIDYDLYLPDGAGPFPIIVAGHGFQRSKANMADWGAELAKRGYIVAALNFPGSLPDHAKNGKIVSALLAELVKQGAAAGDSLQGKVDGDRRGVIGHSAGGLAVILAAAADPTIDVVVGLDPVDNGGMAVAAAPTIKVPATFILAEPGACNSNGNATAVFPKLGGPRLSLKVKGSGHCDGESPSNPLVCFLCFDAGHAPARHLLYRRYAFATLDHVLGCDATMAPWLGGAQAKADAAVEAITMSGFPAVGTGCNATVSDGGVPVVDAGASEDGGVPGPDAAPAPDAGAGDLSAPASDSAAPSSDSAVRDSAAPRADAGASGGGDSGGCAVGGRGLPGPLMLLAIAFFALWRRREGCPRG